MASTSTTTAVNNSITNTNIVSNNNINNNNNNNKNTAISGNVNATTATSVGSPQIPNEKNTAAQLAAIDKAYNDMVNDPKLLDEAANYLYLSLVDDAVLGVFIETHHLHKTGNLSAFDGKAEDDHDTSLRIVDMPNFDIFGVSTAKKPMDCTCPNCDRPVSAARFAPHLEKCMGMGRISSRIASRRLATKEGNSTSSSSSSSYLQTNAGTDDEDDVDWSSEKRRKKTGQNSRNGSKKNNGKSF